MGAVGHAKAQALSGLSVLIAEDNAFIAISLANLLQELGCAVVGPFARVDNCLAEVARSKLDGALLDINLVGGEVYPVAYELKRRGTPFIFCTGCMQGSLPEAFRNAPYLVKPFERDALIQLMVAAFTPGFCRR